MEQQTSFVEPLKRAKRTRTKPKKLSEKFTVLADWYAANKPDVKLLRISRDDAWSLRESWFNDEAECRMAGFHLHTKRSTHGAVECVGMTYRGFDLVETA